MPKNEVATLEQGFQFPALTDDMREAIAEEMDGLNFEFDKIKIPSGGGIAFEIPSDNPDEPDIEKALVGIIVDHYPANVLFDGKYDGEKKIPICSSIGGKVGTVLATGEQKPCNSCYNNEYGSAEDGRGKACKNGHNVYLLREGELYPVLLTLPPTSLKPFNAYMTKRVIGKGLLSSSVLTKITLRKEKSADGIDYAQAQFAVERILTEEEKAISKDYARNIKEITRQQPTVSEAQSTAFDDLGEEVAF